MYQVDMEIPSVYHLYKIERGFSNSRSSMLPVSSLGIRNMEYSSGPAVVLSPSKLNVKCTDIWYSTAAVSLNFIQGVGGE